jgi:hypothetical protein
MRQDSEPHNNPQINQNDTSMYQPIQLPILPLLHLHQLRHLFHNNSFCRQWKMKMTDQRQFSNKSRERFIHSEKIDHRSHGPNEMDECDDVFDQVFKHMIWIINYCKLYLQIEKSHDNISHRHTNKGGNRSNLMIIAFNGISLNESNNDSDDEDDDISIDHNTLL